MFGWGVQDGTSEFQICAAGCQAGEEGDGEGQFYYINELAVDGSDYLYVSDENNHIQKFDPNGNYVLQWGAEGTGDGEFSEPFGMAFDANNHLHVADRYNARIQTFDGDGNYIRQWGQFGEADGEFDEPRYLTIDSAGNIYVVDHTFPRVQIFDPAGKYLAKWGVEGGGPGEFDDPHPIDVASNGQIYIGDDDHHRIQVYSPVNLEPVMSEDSSPIPFELTLSGADVENDSQFWSLLSPPSNGMASIGAVSIGATGVSAATIHYTPTADYHGLDSFNVMLSDGVLTSTVTVSVTIDAVNDAPTAIDDPDVRTDEDQVVVIFPLANDTDIDSDNLTIDIIEMPGKGSSHHLWDSDDLYANAGL